MCGTSCEPSGWSTEGSDCNSKASPPMRFQRFRDFDDGETVTGLGYDIVIRRRNVGELNMPTGELIACDPLNGLETEPFETLVAPGSHPVVLFAAELRDEVRIAYAMIVVGNGEPVRWDLAKLPDEETILGDPHATVGYPVDSSLGSFMDAATAKALMDYSHSVMPDDDDFRRSLRGRVRRRLKRGYGWANVNLKHDAKLPETTGRLNVVAFDAGYGPGLYSTYFGWNEKDELTRIVTDFDVLDFEFHRFPLSPSGPAS